MRYLACICALCLFVNVAHAQDTVVVTETSHVPPRETTSSLLKKAGAYLDSVAEEMRIDEDKSKTENKENLNAFGVPDAVVSVVNTGASKDENKTKVLFPDCKDERLQAETRRLIDEKQAQEEAGSIYQYRRQKLISKNMGEFTNIAVAEFKPRDNYAVADRIITLKINEGLSEDSFRICRGNNSAIGREIFLLMYPKDNEITVEILNFLSSEPLYFSVQ